MSGIQARIRAFETLGNDTSPKPAGPKPPIKLYDDTEDDNNTNGKSTTLSDSLENDPLAKTETLPKRPSNPSTPETPHIPINMKANQLDRHGSGDGDDSFHNIVVGSITSDFVKVSPPRSKPPPLPPRKASENSTSSTNSSGVWSPTIPELDEKEDSSSSHGHRSIKKGAHTPRPIPQKKRIQGFDSASEGGYGSSLSPNPTNRNGRGHFPATSTSSFHSVSLSDHEHNERGGNDQHNQQREPGGREDHEDHDGLSDLGGLSGSYEAVSPHSSSVFSLLEKSNSMASSPALSAASLLPPALPPRPSSISPLGTPSLPLSQLNPHQAPTSSDVIQKTVPYAVRKPPPPPPSAATKAIAGKASSKPAPLDIAPQRSLARSSLASISTTASSASVSSFSSYNDKRSSNASVSTINSNLNNAQLLAKKRAPPPLPPAARARYEALFDSNIQAQRQRRKQNRQSLRPGGHARRAVGWRGVSVDLTTTGQDLLMDDDVYQTPSSNQGLADVEGKEEGADDERLSGQVVKHIWSCSRLPRRTLQTIWNECDPGKKGALDRSSFVNGMWRIDNELLAAASHHTSTSATASRGAQRFSTIRR